jgi:hypothetical protein
VEKIQPSNLELIAQLNNTFTEGEESRFLYSLTFPKLESLDLSGNLIDDMSIEKLKDQYD